MKFGIFIGLQLPRPWQDGDEQRLLNDSLAQVELADRLGLDYAWAQEHHFLEEYSHSAAPEVFLAACSQRTRRIRLGHGIAVMSPNFNAPARVAERIATLDLISGGRVEWGTGESGTQARARRVRRRFRRQAADVGRGRARVRAHAVPRAVSGISGAILLDACPQRRPEALAEASSSPVGGLLEPRQPEARRAVGHGRVDLRVHRRAGGPLLGRGVLRDFQDPMHADRPGGQSEHRGAQRVHVPPRSGGRPRARGLEGAQFFAYGLGHYWRDGIHVPGRLDLWQEFKRRPASPRGRGPAGADQGGDGRHRKPRGADRQFPGLRGGGRGPAHPPAAVRQLLPGACPGVAGAVRRRGVAGVQARDAERGGGSRSRLEPYVTAALERVPPLETRRPRSRGAGVPASLGDAEWRREGAHARPAAGHGGAVADAGGRRGGEAQGSRPHHRRVEP